MADSYGDKILPRQRVCPKCRSFVTHEKINEKQFACPLCSQRLAAYLDLERRITATEIQALVAVQHKNARSS